MRKIKFRKKNPAKGADMQISVKGGAVQFPSSAGSSDEIEVFSKADGDKDDVKYIVVSKNKPKVDVKYVCCEFFDSNGQFVAMAFSDEPEKDGIGNPYKMKSSSVISKMRKHAMG